MESLRAVDIANAVGGKLILGKEDTIASGVSIDSRQSNPGDVFFALIGENTDGHKFIDAAAMKGCSVFVISDENVSLRDLNFNKVSVILVDDSLKALQDLSKWYFSRFDMKKVAVTGSVGKTTTRDILFSIIKMKYTSGSSKANYNSETGMPLTLLSFNREMQACVIEMGMDAKGQIARLAEIAEPDMAIITNIGVSHIERLGTRRDIFEAKMEVAENFNGTNTLIINGDDDMLNKIERSDVSFNLIKVGQSNDSDYIVRDIEDLGYDGIRFNVSCSDWDMNVKLEIPGAHNAVNATLAIAAADLLGIPQHDIFRGLSDISMTGNRLNVSQIKGVTVIDDSYNASPESMRSGIDTLIKSKGKRKIAILGGINELGEISEDIHQSLGRYISDRKLDVLITIGDKAACISEAVVQSANKGIDVKHFDTKESLISEVGNIIMKRDVILIKASRSFKLEDVAEHIRRIGEVI